MIKEMQRVRMRVGMDDCSGDGWREERELMRRVLKGVSGDLRRVLEKEYRTMESGVELKCW